MVRGGVSSGRKMVVRGQKRESMLIWSLVSVQAYSKCDGNLSDAFKPKSNKKSVVTELSCAT